MKSVKAVQIIEAIGSEPGMETPSSGWPKQAQVSVKVDDFPSSAKLHQTENRLKLAMERMVRLEQLEANLNKVDLDEPAFEGDDGLIFDDPSNARALMYWVGLAGDGLVQPYIRGSVQCANEGVTHVLGEWLKSLGVPFEYNISPN